MAEWQTPKTDWTPDDYINPEDYNRWKNNLVYIKEIAQTVYPSFDIEDMGEDKDYTSIPYADEINRIERNLTTIVENTYPFVVGDEKTYYLNQHTLDYEEINRIESACLLIKENLEGQIDGRRRLGWRLGDFIVPSNLGWQSDPIITADDEDILTDDDNEIYALNKLH